MRQKVKYRIRCTTDNTWEETDFISSTDPIPTTCPVDSGHTINTGLTSIVEVIDETPLTNVFTGSRNSANQFNRDMFKDDGVPTNESPYIVPVDSKLTFITVSTKVNNTWEAHVYKNDSSVASLVITNTTSASSGEFNVVFNAGDKIRLRQISNQTVAIDKPSITAYFTEI